MPTDALISQQHPIYSEWAEQWKLLGEAYEGSGGFLDGTNLNAHPRELDYKRDTEGRVTATILQEKPKFTRRKLLARYENFASSIVDTLTSYQFSKPIARTIDSGEIPDTHPLTRFWQDVDGNGTHIDHWLEDTQTIADVYGHVFIVGDRTPIDMPARSRAEQARLRLVTYTPLDVPDWLLKQNKLTSIKTVDYLDRDSLTARRDTERVQYRIWTAEGWDTYDQSGGHIPELSGQHPFGELPVIVMRGRRRPNLPLPGRSVLGDAKLYVDHFNLLSELRELLRSQTFSMLNIVMGADETIGEARGRMGDTSSTETILFSRAPAAFIAPANGPAEIYQSELEKLERKMFRAAGIPWESDSRDAEAEGSRKLKAGELEHRLSAHADEAERIDYQIARWAYMAEFGAVAGAARFAGDDLAILHPNEFVTTGAGPAIEEARTTIALPVGSTAKRLILTRLIPKILEDASPEEIKLIQDEIVAIPIDVLQTPIPPDVLPPADDADDDEAAA